jgi:hypothetical protein
MDKIEQRCIIKFVWKESTDTHEIQQRLKTVYVDSSSAHSTIYEGRRNSKLRRTKIHDFHQSRRLLIDHISDDIIFLLHTFPFHTVHALAETLRVILYAILHHLRDALALKLYHFRWVSHEVRFHLKEKRVVMCCELLELLQTEETMSFAHVVSGDEA